MKFSYCRLYLMLFAGLCGGGALASDPVPANGVLERAAEGLIICAHRGWLAPSEAENSLATMRRTVAAGPFMLEMDLHESGTGTIFMLHDPTVNRTTDGVGKLDELDDKAISALHLKLPGGRVIAEPVPTFEQIAGWAETTPGALLMLDIKDTPPKDAMTVVQKHGLTARVVVLTFSKSVARQALAADPDVLVSVLINSSSDIHYYVGLAAGRRLALYVAQDADTDLFSLAHRTGNLVVSDAIPTIATGILDSKAELNGSDAYRKYLRERPIDILVTNHPQAVAKVVKKR